MADLQASVEHFAALDWTRSTLDDPQFRRIPEPRTVTHDGRGHTLMGKTWNTEETISQRLTVFRDATAGSSFPQPEETRAEFRRFYTFGEDLTAHPGLAHGGVVACVLDSCIGNGIGHALAKQERGPPNFTVQLNITYKKPIKTPGSVIVRSWITKVEAGGRKAWAQGVIESPDGVHAFAEGMWVRPKSKL